MEEFIREFKNNCSRYREKTFSKNEVIISYIRKRQQVCILLEGSADLVRYDLNGNRIVIDHFSKYDIFGEVFYRVTTNNELFVEAKQKSKVLFFAYENVLNKGDLSEKFHEIVLNRVTNLNMRIELLSKRSIREKLLSYFSNLAAQKLSTSFTIPFSLTDLADFLCIDRSAMMREMKLLKEEGFISKNGNLIKLLYK